MVSTIHALSPREVERFYLRSFLLHLKGTMTFAEIRRVSGVQYRSFREAFKARSLWPDDLEWRRVLSDAFRSNFVPLRHEFATILAKCNPNSSHDLRNDHRDMFITLICNCFRMFQYLRLNDTDALTHSFLEVLDYLSISPTWNRSVFNF